MQYSVNFFASCEAQANKTVQKVHTAERNVLFHNLLEIQDSFVKAKARVLETRSGSLFGARLNAGWPSSLALHLPKLKSSQVEAMC